MKTTTKITCAAGIISVAALTSFAGPPVLIVTPPPPPVIIAPPVPPPIVVQPPGVSVNIGVPDSYVWDGSEYVGIIGDQYYYLGPGKVWLPLGSVGLARFHDWERAHHDWRDHAIANEKYRLDAQGHEHAWHHDGH